jgi:hypothetical protein
MCMDWVCEHSCWKEIGASIECTLHTIMVLVCFSSFKSIIAKLSIDLKFDPFSAPLCIFTLVGGKWQLWAQWISVWFEGYYFFFKYFLWCKGGFDFSCEILRDVEKSCYDGFNSKGGYF